MGPLINKLKELKGFRDLLIFPIPYIESIIERETSWHIQNFKKFEDSSTFIYDLSHLLQVEHNPPISSLFLDICGHFSPNGHKIVASEIANILESSFGIEVRAQEEKIEEKRCYIIGISCFYHDSAASLILDGSIIAAAQEERCTRIKHDKSFPINAINFCLEEKQICINDVKAFVYYDYETWTIERVLTNLKYISNKNQYWEQVKKGLFQKLKLPKIIREHTGYQGIIYKTQHHISHAASAYYPSKFDDAAILIIDGVGEWASSTIAKGSGNRIVILKQQHYPHSLGLLYSAFTYYAGFKINSGEYKLMGLAPYGNPRFVDLIKNQLVTINTDGSIMLNMDFFSFHKEQVMTNNKFNQLFGGKPRKRESKITTREMDIAASIQKVTEEIVIKMAKYAFELTKSKNLVMAGGVALNCVVNGRLFEETSFEDFYFQPASSDAGGALGCALSWYFENHPEANKKISEIETTYLGPNFSDDEIYAFLHTMDLPFHRFEKMSRALSIAQNIYENKIVGYFDGKMEFGPRALGSRSILANPLDPAMQSRLNLKIKFRESFRPFAPVYLEERTSLLFDFDKPSPYMSIVKKINSKLLNSTEYKQSDDIISIINQNRSEIPSVTHVDNSARLQSINIKQNQGMYEILQAFETLSGKGILINTSFNVRGEPIVCTPFDAYRCFMRTEIDILVLGNYFLLKSEQPNILSDDKWLNNFELD
jgi:carbamoyltransferase